MTNKLIFNCTYGSDDPERATLPFVAANVAATAGQDAVVLCTIDAVWLGTSDGASGSRGGPVGRMMRLNGAPADPTYGARYPNPDGARRYEVLVGGRGCPGHLWP